MKIVIGTRGSKLALWQAKFVAERIVEICNAQIQIEIIHTRGDKILDVPLSRIGGKGLFVKEIEESLLGDRIRIAVHSLKDCPSELPSGLTIGGVLKRDIPFDAFVSEKWDNLNILPKGATVGTSSLRRQVQLLGMRPDLRIVPLRGNVETRLRRLSEGMDAVILASCGLRRLGLENRIRSLLKPPDFIPAVGQGVIAVECREKDDEILEVLRKIEDKETRIAVTAERAFLSTFGGGCQVPIACYAEVENGMITMYAMVSDIDGSYMKKVIRKAGTEKAQEFGRMVAKEFLEATITNKVNL